MNNITSKFVVIIVAFAILFIGPFVNVSTDMEMLNRRLLVEDVCYFIDSVVDSREISEQLLKEFNNSVAARGVNVNYDITIGHRAVSASADEDYVVTFITDDDFSNLRQGDKIIVHFYTTSNSTSNNIMGKISGFFIEPLDETLSARIR